MNSSFQAQVYLDAELQVYRYLLPQLGWVFQPHSEYGVTYAKSLVITSTASKVLDNGSPQIGPDKVRAGQLHGEKSPKIVSLVVPMYVVGRFRRRSCQYWGVYFLIALSKPIVVHECRDWRCWEQFSGVAGTSLVSLGGGVFSFFSNPSMARLWGIRGDLRAISWYDRSSWQFLVDIIQFRDRPLVIL